MYKLLRLSTLLTLVAVLSTACFGTPVVRSHAPDKISEPLSHIYSSAYIRSITWEVILVDYLSRTIVVKDWLGLEGRHVLRLPPGSLLPYEGQLCPGFRDGFTYYIKIGGKWYSWY